MPQLDLPAYPTQLFWLTILLILPHMVSHTIVAPVILITLRVRARSLFLIETTTKTAHEALELSKNKFYTFTTIKIKHIIHTFDRIRKVITTFLTHQQNQINNYTLPLRLIVNEPLAISEKAILDDYSRVIHLKGTSRIELLHFAYFAPSQKVTRDLYDLIVSMEDNSIYSYRVPRKLGFFKRTWMGIKEYFNLYLPFIPFIHPHDDFILVVAFACVFIFMLRKYGNALITVLTGSYAQDIRTKFVNALSGVSNNLNAAKTLLTNNTNLVKDLKNTYRSMFKYFLIQDKYPAQLLSKDNES
jgi:hypothetical protein